MEGDAGSVVRHDFEDMHADAEAERFNLTLHLASRCQRSNCDEGCYTHTHDKEKLKEDFKQQWYNFRAELEYQDMRYY